MNKTLNAIIKTILTSTILLVGVGFLFFLAMKSVPGSTNNSVAYPAPIIYTQTTSSTSVESLCDTWFAYRKSLSSEKRSQVEEDYKKCIKARTTPAPAGAIKPVPATPQGEKQSSPYKRIAGNGVILESGFSPFSSSYRIINQWVGYKGNEQITIFAGGKRNDDISANEAQDDLSWPGVIIFSVKDKNGQYLTQKSESFSTPINAGPVRVISYLDNMLTLAAKDGTYFVFNTESRQFVSTKQNSPISRKAGKGTIIESGKIPIILEQFDFINYWYYDKDENERVTFMAGKEKGNSKTGVFIVAISSIDAKSVTQKIVYKTSLSDGSLRIADVAENKITLISEEDLEYEFDISVQEFIKLPSKGKVIIVTPGSANFVPTLDQTVGTITPRPTRTPLPTYNPYP